MAGAIGLKGIHNVRGVCDLCGIPCDANKEDLNALDCTYKGCPPMVYHQDCLEKYLKSIRLEKNRKTGFKCPRGCGKGTRFAEGCRGKIDKSHPIHVRHDTKNEKKETQAGPTNAGSKEKDTKKKSDQKATLNVHDLNLVKLVPAKSEELESKWHGTMTRSKSLEKPNGGNKRAMRSKGRKSTGSLSFSSCSSQKLRIKSPKPEALSEVGSGDSAESVKSQGESRIADVDQSSSDAGSLHRASGSLLCESPENTRTNSLPSLQEEALRNAAAAREELHAKCKKCLVQWKTAMLVQQLYRMGFEMWKAISAVHIFGNNMEEAIQWLVENGDIHESQISAILQHHPAAEICIEFELRSMMHACVHHRMDPPLLENAVIQFEGDLTSAISSLTGSSAYERTFPDCDLSLGIVHSESPLLCDNMDMHRSSLTTRASVDALSDDLMLGCVLGSALDDYKRGHADFTDLANKDLGHGDRYASSSSAVNSPLSHSTNSPPASVQDQGHNYCFTCQTPTKPFRIEEAATATTLRHYIGDLLE